MLSDRVETLTVWTTTLYRGGVVELKEKTPRLLEQDIFFKICPPGLSTGYINQPYLESNSSRPEYSNTEIRVVEKNIYAHGFGTLKVGLITVYAGEFKLGWRHGVGIGVIVSYQTNGEKHYIGKYQGQWNYNFRHGYGELETLNGTVIKGEWKVDQLNGAVIEIDPLGKRYLGYYENGKRHGVGQYQWTNNQVTTFIYDHGCVVWQQNQSNQEKEDMSVVETVINELSSRVNIKEQFLTDESDLPIGSEEPPSTGPPKLAQKKWLKQFQNETLPKLNSDLKKATKINLDIDVESFNTAPSLWTLSVYDMKLVIRPIIEAVWMLSEDSFYKEALNEKERTIKIVNSPKQRELKLTNVNNVVTVEMTFEIGENSRLEKISFSNKLLTALI